MLSPHPSDRFQSVVEVGKTLQDISAITYTSKSQSASSTTKTTFLKDLLPKLLFLIPFTAVLILSGFVSLKVKTLDAAPPAVFNSDRHLRENP